MPDMDWDRILSTLRKGREQLQSLRFGSDADGKHENETAEKTDKPPAEEVREE